VQSYAPGLVLLLLILQPARAYTAQESAPAERPRGEFFSGTITALTDDKITVSRTVLGKSTETRTFVINSETRVEGKLRVKVRVTVRFATEEETDRALHIIVRNTQKKQ
jgi:hypothetical protein